MCIYLRKTDRNFCGQGNVRHLTSKVTKTGLVQALNTFPNHSLLIFASGKTSLIHSKDIINALKNI